MVARSLCLTLILASTSYADDISVLSWNVESGGADPEIIAKQLQELGKYDAYCLQEVSPRDPG